MGGGGHTSSGILLINIEVTKSFYMTKCSQASKLLKGGINVCVKKQKTQNDYRNVYHYRLRRKNSALSVVGDGH